MSAPVLQATFPTHWERLVSPREGAEPDLEPHPGPHLVTREIVVPTEHRPVLGTMEPVAPRVLFQFASCPLSPVAPILRHPLPRRPHHAPTVGIAVLVRVATPVPMMGRTTVVSITPRRFVWQLGLLVLPLLPYPRLPLAISETLVRVRVGKPASGSLVAEIRVVQKREVAAK